MHRSLALIISLSILTGSAFAGQIQIGGVNGLTSSYIGASNTGGWMERNYDNYLFGAANNGSPIVPYSTYQQNAASTGSIVDSTDGVTFNMINDGTGSGGSNNLWIAPRTGASTLMTIPIGILDVTDVWTMLNNVFGTPGANDTSVTFNFGNSATAANGTSLTINLLNASSNPSVHSGQIGTAIECTGVGTSTCNTVAIGGLASSSSVGGITVDTNTVFSTNYTSTMGGNTLFAGSTGGTLSLYDQGFIFGNMFEGLYLVNISVTENVGLANVSQSALSAITVDSASTPEPSTIGLGFAGIIAVGLVVLGRRRLA